jgi:hypothetical protein
MGAMAEMIEGLAGGLGVITSPVAAQVRLVAMAERFLRRQLELVDGVIERSPRRTPCLAWVSTGGGRPKCWTGGNLPGWMCRPPEVSFAWWGGGRRRRPPFFGTWSTVLPPFSHAEGDRGGWCIRAHAQHDGESEGETTPFRIVGGPTNGFVRMHTQRADTEVRAPVVLGVCPGGRGFLVGGPTEGQTWRFVPTDVTILPSPRRSPTVTRVLLTARRFVGEGGRARRGRGLATDLLHRLTQGQWGRIGA